MYVCMYVCLSHWPDFVSHSDGLTCQFLPSKETAVYIALCNWQRSHCNRSIGTEEKTDVSARRDFRITVWTGEKAFYIHTHTHTHTHTAIFFRWSLDLCWNAMLGNPIWQYVVCYVDMGEKKTSTLTFVHWRWC
jgi:hypothetical protein